MVVGKGLIASLFAESEREDVVFFASGVSNSLENDTNQFLREELLIRDTLFQNPEKLFIYFSTCSIYDSSKTESDYVLHKLKMEQIIKAHGANYLILRVSNAVGSGGNPNLLLNYLMQSAKNEALINVHTQAVRNLIDAQDIKNITEKLLVEGKFRKIVNVAYLHNYTILEILETIERLSDKKLKLKLEKGGSGYNINIPEIQDYFVTNNLTSKDLYLKNILLKYYF